MEAGNGGNENPFRPDRGHFVDGPFTTNIYSTPNRARKMADLLLAAGYCEASAPQPGPGQFVLVDGPRGHQIVFRKAPPPAIAGGTSPVPPPGVDPAVHQQLIQEGYAHTRSSPYGPEYYHHPTRGHAIVMGGGEIRRSRFDAPAELNLFQRERNGEVTYIGKIQEPILPKQQSPLEGPCPVPPGGGTQTIKDFAETGAHYRPGQLLVVTAQTPKGPVEHYVHAVGYKGQGIYTVRHPVSGTERDIHEDHLRPRPESMAARTPGAMPRATVSPGRPNPQIPKKPKAVPSGLTAARMTPGAEKSAYERLLRAAGYKPVHAPEAPGERHVHPRGMSVTLHYDPSHGYVAHYSDASPYGRRAQVKTAAELQPYLGAPKGGGKMALVAPWEPGWDPEQTIGAKIARGIKGLFTPKKKETPAAPAAKPGLPPGYSYELKPRQRPQVKASLPPGYSYELKPRQRPQVEVTGPPKRKPPVPRFAELPKSREPGLRFFHPKMGYVEFRPAPGRPDRVLVLHRTGSKNVSRTTAARLIRGLRGQGAREAVGTGQKFTVVTGVPTSSPVRSVTSGRTSQGGTAEPQTRMQADSNGRQVPPGVPPGPHAALTRQGYTYVGPIKGPSHTSHLYKHDKTGERRYVQVRRAEKAEADTMRERGYPGRGPAGRVPGGWRKARRPETPWIESGRPSQRPPKPSEQIGKPRLAAIPGGSGA